MYLGEYAYRLLRYPDFPRLDSDGDPSIPEIRRTGAGFPPATASGFAHGRSTHAISNGSDSLISHRQPNDVIAWRGFACATVADFLGDVECVAEQLPSRCFLVNFCADRYRFVSAWRRRLSRGQVQFAAAEPGAGNAAPARARLP